MSRQRLAIPDNRNFIDIISSYLLSIMAATCLIFPLFTRMSHNNYYIRFFLPNVLAVLFMVFLCAYRLRNFASIKKHLRFLVAYLFFIITYNILSYYYSSLYTYWYWDQLHYTIGFLLIPALLCFTDQEFYREYKIFEFYIVIIILSALLCLFLHWKGNQYLWLCFPDIAIAPHEYGGYGDTRQSWLFQHKSQYGLILLMNMAFVIQHKNRFKYWFTYAGTLLLLILNLYICNTMSAIGGGFILIICSLLNKINWKNVKIGVAQALVFLVFTIGGGYYLYHWIASLRSLSSMGTRFLIWPSAIRVILEHPNGTGASMGKRIVHLTEGIASVDNAHNVFLNQALRYSIAVGICFAILFLLLMIYTLYRKFNFFSVGVWGAAMCVLNMDNSLSVSNFTLFLFLIFAIFFVDSPPKCRAGKHFYIRKKREDRECSK